MISTQIAIDQLASRIERAYRRHHPRWRAIGLTPGVWESAASRLLEAGEAGPHIPIDPELFVAAQPRRGSRRDPWAELTQLGSIRHYKKALRRIVRQLRDELRAEVRRADRRLLQGIALEQVLTRESSRISPLARYILATRAGRADLSCQIRPAAEVQYRACPLYRLAWVAFLPGHDYPSVDRALASHEPAPFSMN